MNYLTSQQVADRLKLSIQSAQRLSKDIPGVIMEKHVLLYPEDEIEKLAEARQNKICSRCGRTYPKTGEYWYINEKGYLRQPCKQCFGKPKTTTE